jgi:hypothetical protein
LFIKKLKKKISITRFTEAFFISIVRILLWMVAIAAAGLISVGAGLVVREAHG